VLARARRCAEVLLSLGGRMSAVLPLRKGFDRLAETEIAICRHNWCPRLESNQRHQV